MNKLAPRRATEVTPGCVLRPVVGLDIDGTLGNWHDDFLDFAWRWLYGRAKMPSPEWFLPIQPDMAAHMGVSKEQYRAVKLAYRQSGLKRDMQPFGGAYDLVNAVREAGAEVWVCTTRPYLRLDNIDPDTREWLERHQLDVDGVIFGTEKYRDLKELVGVDRVVGVIDDLPTQLSKAQQLGFPARLIERHHNQGWWHHRAWEFPSLPHLPAAQEWFLEQITNWKARHNVR